MTRDAFCRRFFRDSTALLCVVVTSLTALAHDEPMGRGVIALPTDEGAYVGWRLLRDDPPDVAFDVYRQVDGGEPMKLNAAPIAQTTDFVDAQAPAGKFPVYSVRPVTGVKAVSGSARMSARVDGTPYVALRLDAPTTRFQKVGVADLNGDGAYDWVIKQPDANIDPWHKYWKRSPDTYELEAYLADGTFLWRHDLGWAIERGIWYSPWIAFDLTGDGKAEVAAKIGAGDPRDEDGKVTSGPEWLVVWDGMTGREIARAPWPSRADFPDYNRASRNQIAVAHVGGKAATPALLALRGTYGRMRVDAYRLTDDGKLRPLWRYDNDGRGREYRGQGAHFTLAADVDADGKEEVILGSAVLDDDGSPLWTTGKGHPDAAYLTDVDPQRPGLEIAYVMETRQKTGGLCVADAATGELLWELDEPTGHVHGKGVCADIDPFHPGMEVYGADSSSHKPTGARWMFTAAGKLLRRGDDLEAFGFGVSVAYWDADLQKEIVRGAITDYGGRGQIDRVKGSVRVVADVIGDWREELITSVPGELRIYSTTIPAMDRRVCLMQDPIYRLGTAMNAMGYTQPATTTHCLEATAPSLNLTLVDWKTSRTGVGCRVTVTVPPRAGGQGERNGPAHARFDGRVRLEAEGRILPCPFGFTFRKPGRSATRTVDLWTRDGKPASGWIVGTVTVDGRILRARVRADVPARLAGAGSESAPSGTK